MNTTLDEAEIADLMTIVMGRTVTDGDLIGCGAYTPLVLASGMWAMTHHAPGAAILPVSLTGARAVAPFPISYLLHEGVTLHSSIHHAMSDIFTWGEGRGVDFEPIFPLQLDRRGNVNLSVLGPFDAPTFRGPGAAGVDALPLMGMKLMAYLPRQSRRNLVETVDFVSGVGNIRAERERLGVSLAGGIGRVVTNLAVLEFDEEGILRILSVHPGVTVEDVQDHTGFPLEPGPEVTTTELPTDEELAVLAQVDPLRVRDLEFLSAAQRRAVLKERIAEELAYFTDWAERAEAGATWPEPTTAVAPGREAGP